MKYLIIIGLILLSSIIAGQETKPDNTNNQVQKSYYNFKTVEKFHQIIEKAQSQNWDKLSLGECIGHVALEFIDTKYEANTLEGDGPEICRINFEGLDCVTFFENSLCIARIIKKGKTGIDDLLKEITFTRYRDGVIKNYTSRLHYTSDWIFDNCKKGTILDMSKGLGGIMFPLNVNFMSKNPEHYSALKNNPEFIKAISFIEKDINSRIYYYIPKERIKKEEKFLKTGDIIAIATLKSGLDYSHTGLIYRKDNIPHFLHASSKEKKVILDTSISDYLQSNKSNIGITVLRPIFLEK